MKRIVLIFLMAGIWQAGYAIQDPTPVRESCMAPLYFGPNAFPVPDMIEARTSSEVKVELFADNYFGTMAGQKAADDYTADLFVRLTVPLFTPRVNLVVWGNTVEYFSSGPEVNSFRHVDQQGMLRRVFGFGDIYISTDIQVLKQERMWVDCTLRAAVKTASGELYKYARYYDVPGYFFDASFGRDFRLSERAVLRTSLSGGFLCWQLDRVAQNDAVMYGIQASLTAGRFFISESYGGYFGWIHNGDCPMSIKTKMQWSFGNLYLNLEHQYGFKDWPFHQLRFGLGYRFRAFRK